MPTEPNAGCEHKPRRVSMLSSIGERRRSFGAVPPVTWCSIFEAGKRHARQAIVRADFRDRHSVDRRAGGVEVGGWRSACSLAARGGSRVAVSRLREKRAAHYHQPERVWRHLDTCRFQTPLACRAAAIDLPRAQRRVDSAPLGGAVQAQGRTARRHEARLAPPPRQLHPTRLHRFATTI